MSTSHDDSRSPAPPVTITTEQFRQLERRLRRTQGLLACVVLSLGLALLTALTAKQQDAKPSVADEIRTKRLVVVDDEGVARVVIRQDPADTQRRSRAAGITIYDNKGDERGGMGTMDDGSVTMAPDAPVGVGAPMRDRIGMVVGPDGSSYLMLIDNQTRGVVRLFSDAEGNGGVNLFKWEGRATRSM